MYTGEHLFVFLQLLFMLSKNLFQALILYLLILIILCLIFILYFLDSLLVLLFLQHYVQFAIFNLALEPSDLFFLLLEFPLQLSLHVAFVVQITE